MSAADWTTFDAAPLLDSVSSPVGARREAVLRVEGMHCGACVRHIERALDAYADDVTVQLTAGTVAFNWDPRRNPLSTIMAALAEAGFRPSPLGDARIEAEARRERRAALKRIGVAGILGMQVMMLASGHYFGQVAPEQAGILRWAELVLATPVALYAGWPFLQGAARALRVQTMTMDVPVALAITLAFAVSAWHTMIGQGEVYFDSVVMFVLLLLAARTLQDAGKARAAAHLRRLSSAQPSVAQRCETEGVRAVPVSSLAVGDRVVVAPGEAVPVDGTLDGLAGAFDESLLTGESAAVQRGAGDSVMAGSINVGHQPVHIQVERVGQGSALSQVTRLMQRAESERPQVQMLADRIAGWFLSFMLSVVAIALMVWWPQSPSTAISVALALLVATCPCALSLAVPTVLASASSRLARQGIVLARADVLLRLRDVDTVCFDKTGTLTTGALVLERTLVLGHRDAAQCRQRAAALESGSSHPIARALAAEQAGDVAQQVSFEAGVGVRGEIDGHVYALGAPEALADRASLAIPEDASGLTWVLLTEDGVAQALFGFAPQLRSDAAATVRGLLETGRSVVMLSGDAEPAVRHMAERLGIQHWYARQSPGDKLARLENLRANGHAVLAVGDGVNDAPLLTAADASAALASGSALRQAHADVLLTGSRLEGLAELLTTAQRARRTVVQNLAWAVTYNAVMVPLAFSGVLVPWIAALGMGMSSLVVVANSLRLSMRSAQPSAPMTPMSQPA